MVQLDGHPKSLTHEVHCTADSAHCFGLLGLISAVQKLEQAVKKASFYLKPGCLKQVQTPCHTRVLKPPAGADGGLCTRAKSMATPAESAQQQGSQTDQVCRQIKPRRSDSTADSAHCFGLLGLISAVQELEQAVK